MSEFSDMSEAAAQAVTSRGRLNIQVETIDEGGDGRSAPSAGGNDEILEGSFGGRAFKESTLKLLENFKAGGDEEAADEIAEAESKPQEPDEADRLDAAADAEEKAKAGEPEAKTEEAKLEPGAEWKAKVEHYEAANRNLVSEVEELRAKVKTPSLSGRSKLVDDATREYLDDQAGAVRKFIAAALHHEDPNHADVTAEMALLYGDLTAKELGVSLTESQQATRDAARARQLLAKDKRERKAESDEAANKATADAEAKKADSAATFIGNRLSTRTDYPLLNALAQDLDGMSAGHVIWRTIQRETKTGAIDPKSTDDQLIDAAAKIVEQHYQALADKIVKARPQPKDSQPSTAEKPTEPQPSASKDSRQSHGARTLNKAAASVAPATPPAKKPETTNQEQRPKFKSDKERRAWALRHLPK